jgi:hypothetical protein
MARIIVLPEKEIGEHMPVFDEQVSAIHVDNKHSASQLIERLTWAIHDAEAIEHEQHPDWQHPDGRHPDGRHPLMKASPNGSGGSRGEALGAGSHQG